MKKRIPLSLWRLTAITLALLIFQGCDPNGIEKDVDNTSDMGYEGFQSDVELYYEFAYRKESLLLNYLNYITDGFTKELFKGEITNEDYDKFFHELGMLNADSPKYKAAIQRLESSGVLQSPTRTRGLFGTGMFSWMSGSAKRARNRVLTVASNLSPEERSTLYDELVPEYKRYSSSEEQFWRQLKDGTYDNQAAQIHKDFIFNTNTNYSSLAKEKGLTRSDIVKAEGAAGMKAGVGDMIDTSAKFIPGVDIGANLAKMTDNVDKINNGKDLYEKATNALELLETLEDMAGGDSGLLDEILDELNPVPTKYDVAQSLATKMDHYLKSDIKAGDKEETFGKVTVIDKNKEKPTQYVIVQKKEGTPTDDNTPSIYITGREYMQKGIDLLVKAGNWLVTAIGENGRRETVEIKVKPGQVTTTEVNTAEPDWITWKELIQLYPDFGHLPELDKHVNGVDDTQEPIVEDDDATTKWLYAMFDKTTKKEATAYIEKLKKAGFKTVKEKGGEYIGCIGNKPEKEQKLNAFVHWANNTMTIGVGITRKGSLQLSGDLYMFLQLQVEYEPEDIYPTALSFPGRFFSDWYAEPIYEVVSQDGNRLSCAGTYFLNNTTINSMFDLEFDNISSPNMIKRLYIKVTAHYQSNYTCYCEVQNCPVFFKKIKPEPWMSTHYLYEVNYLEERDRANYPENFEIKGMSNGRYQQTVSQGWMNLRIFLANKK